MTTFLGIDVGTTNVKATLTDEAGVVLASAMRSCRLTRVPGHGVEQDPFEWLEQVRTAVDSLSDKCSLDEVAAIGVSSQAPTLLPVTMSGEPLRPALIWMDRRAEAACDQLAGRFGVDGYMQRSGNRLDPFYVAPKMLWFRTHEPEIFRLTARFMQINGWVVQQITGEFSIDRSHASLMGLGVPGEWDAELTDFVGVRSDQLPTLFAGSDIVGTTRDGALPGIRAGVPVVAGTVDSAAAALEVDFGHEEALLMTGTSSVLVMPRPAAMPSQYYISMAAPETGWHHLGAMVSSGGSISWLRSVMGNGRSIADFIAEADHSPPGARGLVFLPYLAGERSPWWDTTARGGFLGLTGAHTSADMVRSVLEGTALALRQNIQLARAQGRTISALQANGAPASNQRWNQIIADVVGIPVTYQPSSQGSTYGDCRLAARGIGKDLPPVTGTLRTATPDPARHSIYEELSVAFDEAYPALRGTFGRLASLSQEGEV